MALSSINQSFTWVVILVDPISVRAVCCFSVCGCFFCVELCSVFSDRWIANSISLSERPSTLANIYPVAFFVLRPRSSLNDPACNACNGYVLNFVDLFCYPPSSVFSVPPSAICGMFILSNLFVSGCCSWKKNGRAVYVEFKWKSIN